MITPAGKKYYYETDNLGSTGCHPVEITLGRLTGYELVNGVRSHYEFDAGASSDAL